MLLFINVAKFERSGQLLVACWNVDQHHPLTPSSAEEGKSKFPSFLRLVFTHILGWTQGAEVRNSALSLGLGMSHIFCWTPGVRALLMPK